MQKYFAMFAIVFSLSSGAELPENWNLVQHYQETKNDYSVQLFLTAAGHAYVMANAQLQSKKQPLLYCQPKQLVLRRNNYIQIFESQLPKLREERQETFNALPLEAALLIALKYTLPCDDQE